MVPARPALDALALAGAVALGLGVGALVDPWHAFGVAGRIVYLGISIAGAAAVALGVARSVRAARRTAEVAHARHSAVFRGVGEAVVVLDGHDVVVDWNPAAERIYGWSATEAIGKTGRALVDPQPVGTVEAREGEPIHFEASHRRRDGSRLRVAVTGAHAPDPEYGKVFVLVVREVTEQRAIERSLRESEHRLALALAGARMEVWDWDLEAGSLYLGDEARRAVGVEGPVTGTVAEIIARLVHPEDRTGVLERFRPVARGERGEFESQHRTPGPGGRWRWVNVAGRVTERGPAGEPRRITGTLRDATAEKELAARLERAERLTGLGTLAAGVAHEVNNPLAFVAANLEYLREELGREPPRATLAELGEAMEEALTGIARVRETVTGLERFASPAEATAPRPVDVRAELEAALGVTRHDIARRAVLELTIADDLPKVVADGDALRQVFLNLLVNAAQAVPEGRPAEHRVTVTARAQEGRLLVEVKDSGVGIPPEVLPRIFDPFFTTKPVGTGTGLGLSVCHGIVNAMGGTIEVESTPGQGTTFRVSLPFVRPAVSAPEPGASARARVLVVDDEPFVGRALGRILQSVHEVTVTTSALEALGWFEEGRRWDVMLCDLMMPELTGMELEARIARVAPEMVGRIVFMTGGAFTAAAREFVESGRLCIEKPIDPVRLRELVAGRVSAG